MSHRETLAIVVQRAGSEIVGGSEALALQLARAISAYYDVEILSSTALDYLDWSPHYPEGIEKVSNEITIRRFNADFERDDTWHQLNGTLIQGKNNEEYCGLSAEDRKSWVDERIRMLPLGLCHHWIKTQGPYCTGLFDYLAETQDQYRKIFFFTYLYVTTFKGVSLIRDPSKVLFVPTYHDELYGYLPIMQRYAVYKHLFLTHAEQVIAEDLIYRSKVPQAFLGYGIKDRGGDSLPSRIVEEPYIIYAGRLDISKGVQELLSYFEKYVEHHGGLKLIMIGDGQLRGTPCPSVEYLGFVSEEDKYSLMRDALAFIHPSPVESLGIVLIEAFMMGTPALVNGACLTLAEHIDDSNAGYCYRTYEAFEAGLRTLLQKGPRYEAQKEGARKYFETMYSLPSFQKRLQTIIETP